MEKRIAIAGIGAIGSHHIYIAEEAQRILSQLGDTQVILINEDRPAKSVGLIRPPEPAAIKIDGIKRGPHAGPHEYENEGSKWICRFCGQKL